MVDLLLPVGAALLFGAVLAYRKADKEFTQTRLPTIEWNFATAFLGVTGIAAIALWMLFTNMP